MFSYAIDVKYNILFQYFRCCLLNTDIQIEIKKWILIKIIYNFRLGY